MYFKKKKIIENNRKIYSNIEFFNMNIGLSGGRGL